MATLIHSLPLFSPLASISNPTSPKSQNFQPLRVPKTTIAPSLKAACGKGNLREAFVLLADILSQGNPSQTCLDEAYALLIEACAAHRALSCGQQIHARVVKLNWVNDVVFLNTKLVFMYGKCGSSLDAGKVFDGMPEKTIFTWNAMIGANVNGEEPLRAIELYGEMRGLGVPLDAHSFPSVLKACSEVGDLTRGSEIHGLAIKLGFLSNIFIANSLVDMYAKCNDLNSARLFFDRMSEREDVVSWNSIISAYSTNGMMEEALSLFIEMLNTGLKPTTYTLVAAFQACQDPFFGNFGTEVHALVIKYGYFLDVYVANALLVMYTRNNKMYEAEKLFTFVNQKDNICWNSMISGYVQNGLFSEGIDLFRKMRSAGRKPDSVSLMSVLSASGRLGNLLHGKEIHAYTLKQGLDGELQIGNTLVDMYAKCGKMDYMDSVFHRILNKDCISWTTVIAAYSQNNYHQKALQLFRQVQLGGINVDALMIGSTLLACGELRCNLSAKQVHGHAIRRGLYDSITQKTLISVYGDSGNLDYARSIFASIDVKDVVSLTSMMYSFVHNGLANEAFDVALYMKEVGIEPDYVAVLSMLSAAANLSALRKGREIHGYSIRKGYNLQGCIASSLLDMYACCGTLENSFKIFSSVNDRDLVLWTSMINAFGMHGCGEEAVNLFLGMEEENIIPDHITFLVLLHACSHSALVDDGKRFFEIMKSKYNLEPWPEHYACLVDLLGRANHLEEAFRVLRTMKSEPTAAIWCAFLGACHVHSNKELGEIAAKKLLELEPENPGNYVLVSNVYAASDRWEDAEEVRLIMKGQGMKKEPACSWTETGKMVHTFVAHDKSHPRCDEIYQKLAYITKKLEMEGGYVAQTKYVLQNVKEDEKVKLLNGHSERLAMSYVLLVTNDRTPIRIMKNLRVCSDCHTFIKLASKLVEREIIVRDAKRFHHFRNGFQKKEFLEIKPPQVSYTSSRPKGSGFIHPYASLSSFAEGGEGEKFEPKGLQNQKGENCEVEDDELPGMARAFHISSRTASAISICIAVAALCLPLAMKSLGQGVGLKCKVLSYVTLLFGFYMACNIGANDVANAMGTSVGSGALTLRQAVLLAGVLEFSGALLMGTHVTSTMQKGILVASVFQGKDTLLFAGLLSSLAAAGTWLQVASYYGWPVSTTHCIVGSMVGFGLVYGGTGAVFWSSLARVTSSWVISPVIGAMASFLVYKFIRRFVYSARNPGQAAAAAAPIAVFLGVTGISYAALPLSTTLSVALLQALAVGGVGAIMVDRIIRGQLGHLLAKSKSRTETTQTKNLGLLSDVAGPKGTQLEIVYGVFGYMQVMSACFMSFAHGGNDVSNAIGPLAAALSIVQGGMIGGGEVLVIPNDVLGWGGFGIVAGLMMWGYRVISTIGKKITELTPTRGFAAEFAAAFVVLVASKLGLPISATHTLVGAVMGVGFARGLNSVRAETVREIVTSWAVTIPAGACLSVIYTWVFTKLLAYIL
nr:pentatricopeptide repeat-containing protein At3g63370, chloroplastic [Ipomoea batatas]